MEDEPQQPLTFFRFSLAYAVFTAIWCLVIYAPAFGSFVLLYAVILCVWLPYRLIVWLTTKTEPRRLRPPLPEKKESPPATPPPTPGELAGTAKAKYEATLRMLETAGLDAMELHSARAAAKQKYLRELDEAMK